MTTYLSGGWYQPEPDKGLRTEVIDGAMDAAGTLYRAGIRPDAIVYLALKVRGSFGPQSYAEGLSPERRAALVRRLEDTAGDSPELYSFLTDCLEHVQRPQELLAFYLHLIHVARMMQLLHAARIGASLLSTPRAPTSKKKARPAQRATKKSQKGKLTKAAAKQTQSGSARKRPTPQASKKAKAQSQARKPTRKAKAKAKVARSASRPSPRRKSPKRKRATRH